MAPVVLPLAQETSHEGWVGSSVTATALLSGGGWGPGWSGAHGDVRIAGSRMAPVELCWERGLQSRPLGPPLTSTPPAGAPCAAWLRSPPFPAGLAPDSLPIVFLRGRDSGPHAAPRPPSAGPLGSLLSQQPPPRPILPLLGPGCTCASVSCPVPVVSLPLLGRRLPVGRAESSLPPERPIGPWMEK